MVGLRLIDPQYFAAARRIRQIRISSGDLPFRDHALVIKCRRLRDGEIRRASDWFARVGVEFSEAGARGIRVAGMESEAEQPALTGAGDEPGGEIKERGREQRIVLHNPNQAVLLINEEAPIADRGEIVRRGQAAGDRLQFHPDRALGDARRERSRRGARAGRGAGSRRRTRARRRRRGGRR